MVTTINIINNNNNNLNDYDANNIIFIHLFIDTHFPFLSLKSELKENQLYAVKISLTIPDN